MAQYGMGVLYEKADDGTALRIISPELREEILNHFYWPHHQKLNKAVKQQLNAGGKALIVDCHSFPSESFIRDLSQNSDRPDFNIGTDVFHTPNHLIEISQDYFRKKGFSLGLYWPYSGSIVPTEHYRKNKNVQSIMLEINRTLYLKEPSKEKSNNYALIREVVAEYLEIMSRHA
jgi:N-formylglutamate deformylase